ncbi:permease-like cell division protein FtsX [Desulfurella sp.]|uniref:permease-like cell division protein FtsX n=1 Tax=Desulfurella sp. TaxID=1962857 RepID=UPI0025C30224|nr:permease-like cell division protein FtsX [Desulfurella sp.]
MKKDSTRLVITFIMLIFLLIISFSASILYTVNNYLESKRSNVPVFVFFKDNVSKEQALSYANSLKTHAGVKSVKFIDKSEALSDILSKLNLPLQQFSENPLPYSLEIFLKPQFAAEPPNINSIEKTLKSNNLIDEVRIPKGLFANISQTTLTFKEFSYVLLGTFILLEIIILALLLKISYDLQRSNYNKLKLFGIKRLRIFLIFLKQTIVSWLFASLFSVILGSIIMFLYINYINLVPAYQNDILISFGVSSGLYIVFSLIILTILSLFVFFIEDEKI